MLLDLLKGMNIPENEMEEIIAAAKESPMLAIGKIQKYLTPEMMQQMVQLMQSNPDAMNDAMKQAGVSDDDVSKIQDQFGK
ncbi:MAG: DUF2999 family protein [Lentisphaeria bacterium]|nr:DUF2999 family protein [Lentisphaeria bacterium]